MAIRHIDFEVFDVGVKALCRNVEAFIATRADGSSSLGINTTYKIH
jgi:hypothetical protein